MNHPQRRSLSILLSSFLFATLGLAETPPNFIFILVDDVSWNDLGCYGAELPKTPNIDRLAAGGLVFDAAYLTTSSCSPSRCSIISGRYPHNTGASELHTTLPADQPMFPALLREAGYYTALSGKNHMGPAVKDAFDLISKGKGPGKEGDWVEILAQRPSDQPFFFWFASTDAHRDWTFTEEGARYDPEEVQVPPYLYDGPQTREDLAGYYHEISRIDHYVGAVLEELERQEIASETYVIFCSDNGRPFPRCKTRLYDSGIRTPLIFWGPASPAGERSPSLVSAIDIAPTVLELAQVSTDPRMQGVSFCALLDDPKARVRDYAFAEHNWHVFQAHERSVRHGDQVYIRNAFPERQNLCLESTDRFPAGAELWQAEADGRLNDQQRDVFLVPRPAEELYDLASDPYQLNNLAAEEDWAPVLAELRGVLDRWSVETRDSVPTNPKPDRGSKRAKDNQAGPIQAPGAELGAPQHAAPGPILRDAVHMATGIKIGEVTQDSALVWTRLTRHPERNGGGLPFPNVSPTSDPLPEGKRLDDMEGAATGSAGWVRVKHWPAGRPAELLTSPWIEVDAQTDFTHSFSLEGLQAGSEYELLVEGRAPGESTVACRVQGSFGSAPAREEFTPVRFCVVTGQGYNRRDDPERGHRIYDHMLSLEPDFFVHTGDALYYDKPRPWARTVELARFKWNRMAALPFPKAFHSQVPAYFLKDDHDTLKNDCWPGQSYGSMTWEDGVRIFNEQGPLGPLPYRSVRWGRDLQVWFVEGREYRSANKLPDGPDKTIWGAEQKRWLFESLGASDAAFRLVISATPIVGPDRSGKNDNHANAGFASEGDEVRKLLSELDGVMVICGDRHWQYVSKDPQTGLREFSCGPTTDKHAGGFSEKKRSSMHEYLNVVGGFLQVEVRGSAGAPELVLRHHGTRGQILHEEFVSPSAGR